MTNVQTTSSHTRRIFMWFRRHKITAVFAVLIVALLLWLFGSWVILNVQINSERKRFNDAYNYMTNKSHFTTSVDSPVISRDRFCSYRGDPGFGASWLSCEVGSNATYSMITKQQAQMVDDQLRMTLEKDSIKVHTGRASKEVYELSSYSFMYRGLKCDAGTQYYDKEVPNYNVYDDNTIPANSARVSLSCHNDAKAEYFPVTKD